MRERAWKAVGGVASAIVFLGTACGGGDGSCTTIEEEITQNTTLSGCVEAPDGIYADGDYLITVEPGTTITFGQNADFVVRLDARLNAVGTEDEPIVFTGEDDTPSFWGGVKYISTQSTENRLEWVTIENGGRASGDSGAANAGLDLNDWGGPVQLAMNNTTVTGAEGFGIRLGEESELSEFSGNTITGNGSSARVTKRSAQYLVDDTNDFTGNDEDIIDMDGGGLTVASTWPKITGTEYFVIDEVTISGEDDAEGALTIEPGVTVRFEENTHLLAARGGTLTAEGTADAPIVLAGNEAIGGYWAGVGFITTQSNSNVLNNVTVADAGGQGFGGWSGFSEQAAVSLNSWGGPVVVEMNDVTISNSGTNGVYVSDSTEVTINGCSNLTFESVSGVNFEPASADCS
jgi:hypothetical protein